MAWFNCGYCGNSYNSDFTHVCYGRAQPAPYAPNPPGERSGAVTIPLLTEERVREIVREELARAGNAGVERTEGGSDAQS